MQGRKGEGTGGVYTKPDPEQLIDIYSRGYAILDGAPQDQKVTELETQLEAMGVLNTRLRAEVERLKAEQGAFDEKLERMREHFDERLDRNSRLETKVVYGEEAMVEMVNKGWELMKELKGNRFIVKGQTAKTEG